MASTRIHTELWLIGQPIAALTGSKLPLTSQVLSRFFYLHNLERKPLRESARLTVQEALCFWVKAGVPTQEVRNATDSLLRLHRDYLKLKKDFRKTGELYVIRRQCFKESLNSTFDLATVDAVEIMEDRMRKTKDPKEKAAIAEDLQFYKLLCESRTGSLASVDTHQVKKFKRDEKRKERGLSLKHKYEEDKKQCEESMKKVDWAEVKEEFINEEEKPEEEEQSEFVLNKNYLKGKVKKNVLTPSLLTSLDRNALTDRRALRTVKETATALGHDIKDINLSRSTIRRHRESSRANARGKLPDNFSLDGSVVLLWDGKRLQGENGWVERLVVVAIDLKCGVEQLLGISKLKDGTGRSQAEAVLLLAREWDLAHRVVGLSFDTTASNTSPSVGACVLIEQGLGRKLLRLACRHHVLELPVKGGFDKLIGPSKSPDIPLFSRFKAFWPEIDQEEYMSAAQLHLISQIPNADELILFCKEQLSLEVQPRDDYKMLLLYSVIFMGGVPPGGVNFYKPIAVSRARFQAAAIYCLLISMFSHQFTLSAQEKSTVFEVAVFVVTAHVRSWFEARLPAVAPRTDLQFLHTITSNLLGNKEENARKVMWKTAGGKFLGHLWYLSPELVTLALFDRKLDADTKLCMVSAMSDGDEVDYDNLPNRGFIVKLDKSVLSLKLSVFVNAGSMELFNKLGVMPEFLAVHPSEWISNENYLEIETIIKYLPCVNDSSERNVKIATDFHKILVKDENQKQGLFLNVANDRKNVPQK